MRKIIAVIFIVLGTFAIQAQKIQWMTFEEALKAQQKQPKKIIMDVYTEWCGPCKMLEENTFQNKDVAAYISKNYYAVKFNAEGNQEINYKGTKFVNSMYNPNAKGRNGTHDLTHALKIRAYPTIIFFDEKGNYVSPLTGYYKPTQIEIFLKIFSKEEYKGFTTKEKWDGYYASFKNEFKD